jgi:hypothetical protein
MDYPRARERLRRMARDTIFQPRPASVPIQVLGVLESAGLEFDHLWVMGLTDDAWPLPARPNPFVPARLQRAAGVPQADPVTSLELDQRITGGWMRAAPEVVFSHARLKGESELAPSPLIKALPVIALTELRVEEFPLLRDAIRAQGAIETLEDAKAPAIVDTGGAARRGGTSLFRDQAVCPFKAYAKHRLASDSLETPRPGLSLRDRGSLVHCMLGAVWKSLETSERLAATSAADLDKLLHASADEAIAEVKKDHHDALAGRFGELEHARLVRIGPRMARSRTRARGFPGRRDGAEAPALVRRRHRQREARPHGPPRARRPRGDRLQDRRVRAFQLARAAARGAAASDVRAFGQGCGGRRVRPGGRRARWASRA